MIPADYIRNGGRIFFVWEIAMKAAVKQPTVIVVEGSSDAWKIRDDDGEEGEYYSSWCHLICQIQIQAIRPTTAGDLCFAVINIRL